MTVQSKLTLPPEGIQFPDNCERVVGARKRHGLRAALLVGLSVLVLTAPLFQSCATSRPDILQMVADAKTPADHESVAAYYEREAADNEAQASSHPELAETYRRFHNSPKVQMAPHCEQMADYYSKIAAEDSELAAEHRRLAQAGR